MQLITNEEQKEIKSHGDYSFPVCVSREILHNYERGSFLWHWHPEMELTYITRGEIIYQVNNQVYHLKEGDGLFCNSNALHTGWMSEENNCHYSSITFHPRMIYGYEGSSVYQQYMKPIIQSSLGSYIFQNNISWEREIIEKMRETEELFFKKEELYEIKIQQCLSRIWLLFCENFALKEVGNGQNIATERDVERLRKILSFLEKNYMEKITLEDIAKETALCKGECCRFFKRLMNCSLFDYILYYRIEKSLPLLTMKQLSVTEIAEQTGFSSASYFARVFKKQFHCSPSEYRKKIVS